MNRFYLSEVQQFELNKLIQEAAVELVSISFAEPADDQKTMRRAIYLRGRLDAYSYVLTDDFPQPEPDPEI